MNAEFHTTRTELANEFAEAGRELLAYMGTDAALAAIPSTDQYVVAGTLQMIAKVLPAVPPVAAAEQPSALTNQRILEIADENDYADEDPKCITRLCRAIEREVTAHLARQSPAPEKTKSVGWATFGSKDGKYKFDQAMLASNPDYIAAHDSYVWEPVYLAAPVAQEVEPGSAPAAADEVRNQALEEAARAIQSMGDLNPPISFGIRCAEAIRALKTTASAATSEEGGAA